MKKDYSDKIIRDMEEMLSRHQTLISLMVTSKGLVADDTTQLLIRLNTSSMQYMVPKSDVDITEQSDYKKELSDVLVKLMYLSEKDLA